jgi:hypothetical protein
MSRSPSSGAHSRDPLAHPGYACWSFVIASVSEAIQRNKKTLDCFVAPLLAMTGRVVNYLVIASVSEAIQGLTKQRFWIASSLRSSQ